MDAKNCRERIRRLSTYLGVREDAFGKIERVSLKNLEPILKWFREMALSQLVYDIKAKHDALLLQYADIAMQHVEDGRDAHAEIECAAERLKDSECQCRCEDCENFEIYKYYD